MLILIWVLTLLLLALWSLAGWGLHTLLALGPGWLDQLPAWISRLPYPALLERWLPDWQQLLIELAGLAQTALSWLGAAGSVLVWVLWAAGAAGLLLLALLMSWAVRKLQTAPSQVPSPRAAA